MEKNPIDCRALGKELKQLIKDRKKILRALSDISLTLQGQLILDRHLNLIEFNILRVENTLENYKRDRFRRKYSGSYWR